MRTKEQLIQESHMHTLQKRYSQLFQQRRRLTDMLLRAIAHGVDIRTTDTWPRYQAIVDELWLVTNQIKAVASCLR